MYLSHFDLAEAPFSIAPNPRHLYLSRQHQEALAHLLYGVNGDGGFVLLTGEIGAGKTTVCRALLEQIPETCDVAYVFNPKLSVEELLSTICTEFGIACPPGNSSVKVFVDAINAHLLDAHARGRHAVLIIDEAQSLSVDVLEQMRLLTNLETGQRKLLQIILLGQPELADLLARPELRQLAQRIVARYHLGPLVRSEVGAYVQHRLDACGARRRLFPAARMRRLYRLSRGVPRVINVICDRALLGAYAQGLDEVDAATLEQAAREVLPRRASRLPGARPLLLAAGLFAASTALALAVVRPAYWNGLTGKLGIRSSHRTIAASPVAEGVPPPAPVSSPDVVSNSAANAALNAAPAALAWPAGEPRAQSRQKAYARLFREWGAAYDGADPCRQADGLGLGCRSGVGGLEFLRQLNRPAVLSLHDGQGSAYSAVLLAIDEKSVRLDIGGQTRTAAIGDLAAYWSGDYTALVREPPEPQGRIRIGKRGPVVQWVAGQLARLDGREPPSPATDIVFDDALERQVRKFQIEQGLVPDGHPGAQTLMRLSSAGDRLGPKLSHDGGR